MNHQLKESQLNKSVFLMKEVWKKSHMGEKNQHKNDSSTELKMK